MDVFPSKYGKIGIAVLTDLQLTSVITQSCEMFCFRAGSTACHWAEPRWHAPRGILHEVAGGCAYRRDAENI